jgi:protein-tyrosine phosphatase
MMGTGHVDVEGCFNVRDAGGWPTEDGGRMATGMLYRADEPVRLTEAGRDAIGSLGLAAVIDLRQQHQIDRGHLFADLAITHHIPLVDRVIDTADPPALETADDFAELYVDMVARGGERLVGVVDTIAEHLERGPVLIHCVAGKDRTGVVVALVQAAIGVTLPSIIAEYARSDEPTRQRRAAMLAEPLPDDPPVARSPAALWTATPETMAAFAQLVIATHGSLAAWPAGVGISPSTVDQLRRLLLAR